MQRLKVLKKTGFKAKNRVVIFDHTGRLFYQFTNVNGDVYFNLPKGIYFSRYPIFELPKPLAYKREIDNLNRILAKKQRNGKVKLPPIRVGKNPNKASIFRYPNPANDFILIDNYIAELPRVQKIPILFHELGHYLYADEHLCDAWGARELLRRGWNPSQVVISYHLSLSGCSHERKNKLKEKLKRNGK